MNKKDIKEMVREGYAKTAKGASSCCSQTVDGCCGAPSAQDVSREIGYSEDDLNSVPEGANLGLGCGNPVALASLKTGETVLDLGAGGGFDCFLAAGKVGSSGRIIGVDMTPEMVEKARENAGKGGYGNVEFRLGEIERLPVETATVDAIISNCVINLSPEKDKVFAEAFRVLKPGGRLMVSDIVLLEELPDFIKDNAEAYIGCVSGAVLKETYIDLIKQAGFSDVRIMNETPYPLNSLLSESTLKSFFGNMLAEGISMESILEKTPPVVSLYVYAVK